MYLLPMVESEPSFDTARDFVPVSLLARFEFGVVAGPAVGAKDFKQFVAWLKANSAKATYGVPSSGTIPHFTGSRLFTASRGPRKGDLEHVLDPAGWRRKQDNAVGPYRRAPSFPYNRLPRHGWCLPTTTPTQSVCAHPADAGGSCAFGYDLAIAGLSVALAAAQYGGIGSKPGIGEAGGSSDEHTNLRVLALDCFISRAGCP
jgi:hypothetical protein